MSKLDELIAELCPDGVPFKRIKDVYTRLKGTPITAGKMKDISSDEGEIRIFAGGKTVIDMLKRLRSQIDSMPVKYTHDEIVAMKDKLTNLTNKSTAEKKQHIENIKTKCPFCGSDLVKRNGKYGAFWGCSAYPKCKFTRPIDK